MITSKKKYDLESIESDDDIGWKFYSIIFKTTAAEKHSDITLKKIKDFNSFCYSSLKKR